MSAASQALAQTLRHIRKLAGEPPGGSADRELLKRFVNDRDEQAFAEFVRRHGALVFGIAHRWVVDRHEAEDVVQAIFLALARQALRLDHRKPLTGWLYTVAYRLARKAQTQRARRQTRIVASRTTATDPLAEITGRELLQALDEELARLPERYRLPLLLCGLDGLTRDEAAHRLGWSVGTLHGRLERGRELLRKCLTKRGLMLPATLAGLFVAEPASALSPALVATVTKAALTLPAGAAVSGATIAAVAGVLLLALGAGAGLALRPDEKGKEAKGPTHSPSPEAVVATRADVFGDPLPDGVVARLGSMRLRHPQATAVAFSPDGKLVSFGLDATVRRWDIDTGRLLAKRDFEAQGQSPGTWLLSTDGRRVIFQEGAGKGLVVCDSENGTQIAVLPRTDKMLSEVALAPNGHTVAFQDWLSKRLYTWESESNQLRDLSKFDSNSEAYARAFSRDSRRFAACLGDRIFVWDVTSGSELLKLKNTATVCQVAFDSSGDVVAVLSCSPNQSLTFYRVSTGARAEGWIAPEVNDSWIRFAPDGKTLTLASESQWRWWDPIAGRIVRTFEGGAWHGVVFSPDGKLAAGTFGNTVRIWDIGTGKRLLSEFDARSPGDEVAGLAVASDGKTIATFAGREYRFWDGSTAKAIVRFVGSEIFGRHVSFTRDGHLLGAAGDAVALSLYDPAGREVRRFGFDDSTGRRLGVYNYRLAEDGRTLAALTQVVGNEGESVGLTVWDFASGKRLAERRFGFSNSLQGYGAFTPDLRWYAVGDSLWRLDGVNGQRKLDPPDYCSSPTVMSADGRLIAVYLFETVKRLFPDGREWYGPHRPRGIAVFETATCRRILHLDAGEAGQMVFSPDGRELAAAGRYSLAIWDLSTARPRITWTSHIQSYGYYGAASVSSMAYWPDGRKLITGHNDNSALIREIPAAVRPMSRLSDADRDAAWRQLGGYDAAKAYEAVWRLADDRGSVDFLRTRMTPALVVDPEKLSKLIVDLDSSSFQKREAAAKTISEFGHVIVPSLVDARPQSRSAEVKNRLQSLVDEMSNRPNETELQQLRGVHVIELCATPAAREHLKTLAGGASGARLTEAAAAAMKRFDARKRLMIH